MSHVFVIIVATGLDTHSYVRKDETGAIDALAKLVYSKDDLTLARKRARPFVKAARGSNGLPITVGDKHIKIAYNAVL